METTIEYATSFSLTQYVCLYCFRLAGQPNQFEGFTYQDPDAVPLS